MTLPAKLLWSASLTQGTDVEWQWQGSGDHQRIDWHRLACAWHLDRLGFTVFAGASVEDEALKAQGQFGSSLLF